MLNNKLWIQSLKQIPLWKLPHEWNWPGNEHVDPMKEAQAEAIRLKSRTLTLAEAYAKRGKDWERGLKQIQKEAKAMVDLGLTDDDVKELSMEERIQKIYLGVGVVVTKEEARQILIDAGADITAIPPDELIKTATPNTGEE